MTPIDVEPNVIIESALALTIAITATDAMRDLGMAFNPDSLISLALARIIFAIITIMFTMWLVGRVRQPNSVVALTTEADIPAPHPGGTPWPMIRDNAADHAQTTASPYKNARSYMITNYNRY